MPGSRAISTIRAISTNLSGPLARAANLSGPLARAANRAAIALLVFALAWGWLSLRPPAPLHEDTSRDLALARDLVTGTILHRHGAWASFASLEQGTSWIDFLALCQFAGLGVVGIERVLTTLLAASVGLAYLGFAALLDSLEPVESGQPDRRSRAALIGALVLLMSLPFVCEMPVLWQPTLLPVALVFAHLSMWRLLRDGASLDALATAVFCALALDLHIVSVAILVPALVAVTLASRRPLATTLGAFTLGFATLALSSWTALWDNLDIMIARGWLAPSVVVAVAALGCGALARPRYLRLAWSTRLWLALALELTMLALLVAASFSDATPSLTGRYLSPFLPAIALACALLGERALWPARGSTRVALVVMLAALVVAGSKQLRPSAMRELPLYPQWSIAEFEPVADALRQRELTWTDLIARLQGPSTAVLLGHLSSLVEPGSGEATWPDRGLLVLALAPEQSEAVAQELGPTPLTAIDLDSMRVLLIDTPARTDHLGAQLCRDGQHCVNVILAVTNRVAQAHLSAWVDAEPAAKWLAQEGERLDEIQWRIPVRAGEPATLLLSSMLPEHCAWAFVASEGFALSTTLPTHLLELPGDAVGTLLVSRRLDESELACAEHALLPPAIVETAPQWTRLRALLAPRWSTP